MHLDVQTLSVVTVFVTALLGALLLFAAVQNRGVPALMWWGLAYMAAALGLSLLVMRGTINDVVSIDLANAIVLISSGMIWTGARTFDGRRLWPPGLVIAPAIWLAALRIPAIGDDINMRVVVMATLMATLAALTAEEFWRGRDEPLMSRWPTIIVLLADAAVLLARIPATLLSPILADDALMSNVSFALIAFGTLLFTVVLAFLLLNMTKERTELKHKIASLIDPLSGVANRRAFLEGAQRLLARQKVEREPLAMMLFDLDWFKDINDRLGHAVGDQVLQVFASSTTATLGSEALFGRIGGEEFAAIAPVGDLGEAYAVADRVRRNFAVAASRYGRDGLTLSVSAGVTIGRDPAIPVEDLLAVADRALYRAKAQGRNRVEAAEIDVAGEDAQACAQSIVTLIKQDRAGAAA